MAEQRNLLFLCTGNSARSIMAEALVNALGGGRFRAWSAGSQPKGRVHPQAWAALQQAGLATAGLRSKSWDEFGVPGAPVMDAVITVCGNAARESCPAWPGQPLRLSWDLADPAAVESSGQAEAFAQTLADLRGRIEALLVVAGDTDWPERVMRVLGADTRVQP